MRNYVGIDLGTTNSALAHIGNQGEPEIVPNSDGERMTPSVVYFDRHEGIKLVGSAARDGGDPSRTVRHIKRHMDDADYAYKVDGRKWTPTDVSALILAKLKRDAEGVIGDIDEAVITVPANFNELARKATVSAGRIAGINVRRIVNEPTAAAIYYAHMRDIEGRVMVFDLGGGTLDVTILEVTGDQIDILVSEGARHLGGGNFDACLLDVLAAQYKKHNKAELYTTERQRIHALLAAEDAKHMLSKLKQIHPTVGNDVNGISRVTATRDMFELAIEPLMTRTEMLVEQTLDSVALEPGEIDHILLVGGSTRIPAVSRMLEARFGRKPVTCGNVDECVALGAALFARDELQVNEICNHSYGTLILLEDAQTGEALFRNCILIPKNTPIPCSLSQTFLTSRDNETLIEVEVTQGEDHEPDYVDVVGKLTLRVPPGRPAGCPITVTYSYDENQRISAEVIDETTGKSTNVEVEYFGSGTLSERDIERKSTYLKSVRIE